MTLVRIIVATLAFYFFNLSASFAGDMDQLCMILQRSCTQLSRGSNPFIVMDELMEASVAIGTLNPGSISLFSFPGRAIESASIAQLDRGLMGMASRSWYRLDSKSVEIAQATFTGTANTGATMSSNMEYFGRGAASLQLEEHIHMFENLAGNARAMEFTPGYAQYLRETGAAFHHEAYALGFMHENGLEMTAAEVSRYAERAPLAEWYAKNIGKYPAAPANTSAATAEMERLATMQSSLTEANAAANGAKSLSLFSKGLRVVNGVNVASIATLGLAMGAEAVGGDAMSNHMPGLGDEFIGKVKMPSMKMTEGGGWRYIGYIIPFISTPLGHLMDQEDHYRHVLNISKRMLSEIPLARAFYSEPPKGSFCTNGKWYWASRDQLHRFRASGPEEQERMIRNRALQQAVWKENGGK